MKNIYEKLRTLTQADMEPGLTESEIEQLVQMYSVPDAAGRTPDNPEWEPAIEINLAVANGWRIKAAKLAHQHDATVDSQGFSASQKFTQCMELADTFMKKVKTSFSVTSKQ